MISNLQIIYSSSAPIRVEVRSDHMMACRKFYITLFMSIPTEELVSHLEYAAVFTSVARCLFLSTSDQHVRIQHTVFSSYSNIRFSVRCIFSHFYFSRVCT